MPSMGPKKFMAGYELVLDKEFEYNGKAAEWAPGKSHRFWGDEDAQIALKDSDPNEDRRGDAEAAMSPDDQFLAIATNAIIRIYHVQSRGMRAELVGHSKNLKRMFFKPMPSKRTNSSTRRDDPGDGKGETYCLLSATDKGSMEGGEIISWSLDENGRQLHRMMPFAVQNMADQAIGAISADLKTHHTLSDENLATIRAGFMETLRTADTKNRARNLPVILGAFPSFGTYPISHDGKSVLYTVHGNTTQHGMRPPEELPQIVVLDFATHTERCRLNGHTDAIMWAGWSPDDKTIATASWDSHYKLWDADTGECKHDIGPTGCQNWAGAFSPDGKYVLLSGGRGDGRVTIYSVDTGEEYTKLQREGIELKDWVRYFAWNPAGDCIALVNDQSIVLWHPFNNDRAETILTLSTDGSMLMDYNGFSIIKWAQGGRKLLLQDTDQTTFVWDREKYQKWRFQRPQGTPMAVSAHDVFYLEEADMVVSMDGDRKVRFWKL